MIALRVPACLACRPLVAAMVSAGCALVGERRGAALDDRFVDELVTAVGEAFNNAVLHAHADLPEGTVALQLDASDEAITVTLSHAGDDFDLHAVPSPQIHELPESGMGLFLIRATVDEVIYRPGDPHCMILRKRLRP